MYARSVSADVAPGWAGHCGATLEDLETLAVCATWRSHPDSDARAIAVMRVT